MYKKFSNARDPISSYTHFLGATFSVIATIILLIKVFTQNQISLGNIISSLVFGFSMLALYCSSSIYHYITGDDNRIKQLRKLDHAMIYVLIAGTYTPIYISYIGGQHGIRFTIIIWTIAIIGIIIKMFWISAPRWLSTSFYILMGWAIVFDLDALKQIEFGAIFLIAAGGVAYTIGGIIYFLKKPQITKNFGFHEIFHVFVMLGTFFQFLAILLYVI